MIRRPPVAATIATAVVGVYVLVIVGATAALADAAAACSGWPLCGVSLDDPATIVGAVHRIAAGVVGVLVLTAAVVAWGSSARRVRAALAVAVALYPIQIAVGAFVAGGVTVGPIHLLVAMTIFGALVVALAWQLEAETGTDDPDAGSVTGTSGPTAGAKTSGVEAGTAPQISTETTAGSLEGLTRVRAIASAYFRLMKPRLMWLLCLVAGAGMALAGTPSVGTVVATLGGGVLAIGASGTFNHVLERDVDRRMQRTADRPLASHEIPIRNALAFGGVLTVGSLAAFLTVNLLAAALGLVAITFYSVVYTLILKPNTVQNTVLGGAAGALPALIGYVAVADGFGLPGVVLACVIFLWTPAHFYNLALAYKEDYERGGFPMMPVVRGETETRKHILLYLGGTLLGASVLAALVDFGWLYGATTVGVGAVFLWMVVRLHREQTEAAAFRAFHASNAYLGLLLVAIIVEALAV
ncbi:MAG: heme o synthase [Natronomonas sp.]